MLKKNQKYQNVLKNAIQYRESKKGSKILKSTKEFKKTKSGIDMKNKKRT